jgi:hypothetical protein
MPADHYTLMIHHYMPNSQRLVFVDHAHMVGGKDWDDMTAAFLEDPYPKISPEQPAIIAY